MLISAVKLELFSHLDRAERAAANNAELESHKLKIFHFSTIFSRFCTMEESGDTMPIFYIQPVFLDTRTLTLHSAGLDAAVDIPLKLIVSAGADDTRTHKNNQTGRINGKNLNKLKQ